MKTIFTKMGILMTLIFSFLFSLIVPNTVNALEAGDIYEQHATINNISLVNHVLSFDVKNASDIDVVEVSGFTYKYTYWVEDTLVGELKQDDNSFTRDGSKYVIQLDEKVVGVTIYKVRFKTNNSYITLDTNGTNIVGNCANTKKINWVQLDKGKILSDKSEKIYAGQDLYIEYVYNSFYFNFSELVVDDVIDVDMRYYLYTNTYEKYKFLWWNVSEKSENTDPVEHKYEVAQTDSLYQGWEDENFIIYLKCLYGNCTDTYKRYAIEKSDNDMYQWKINLPTTAIRSSSGGGHTWIETEIIEQADITTMSYIIDGKEFIDIPVYQESSGFVYMPEYSRNGLPWWFWLIVVGIILLIIGILAIIFKPIGKGIIFIFKLIWWIIVAIYYVLKWTIFLPITLIVRHVRNKDDDVW